MVSATGAVTVAPLPSTISSDTDPAPPSWVLSVMVPELARLPYTVSVSAGVELGSTKVMVPSLLRFLTSDCSVTFQELLASTVTSTGSTGPVSVELLVSETSA